MLADAPEMPWSQGSGWWGVEVGTGLGETWWYPSLILCTGAEPWSAFVLVHDAVLCTPLGLRWMAGILGMQAESPSCCHVCPGPVFLLGIAAVCWGGSGQSVALLGQQAWQQG